MKSIYSKKGNVVIAWVLTLAMIFGSFAVLPMAKVYADDMPPVSDYAVDEIISLAEDDEVSLTIPLGDVSAEEAAAVVEAGLSLSLIRNNSRFYVDPQLYPNQSAGGPLEEWLTQGGTPQFTDVQTEVKEEDGETVLEVTFNSNCYFYSRGVVDYSAPHSNGGAYLDICGYFNFVVETADGVVIGMAPVKIAPYDSFHTMDEIYTDIDAIAALDTDLYVEKFSMGTSSYGLDMPYLIVAKDKAAVEDWLEFTELSETAPAEALEKIESGAADDIKVPVMFSNIHSNEVAASDGILGFAWKLVTEDTISYDYLESFTAAGEEELAAEFAADSLAVPDLVADKATYLGYLKAGNSVSGVVDLETYYEISENEIAISDLLEDVFFILVPEENVDGRTFVTRAAFNGYDLNRDNSFQTTPETANMQHLISTYNPVSLTEFHGRVQAFQCEPCDPPHEPNFEYDLLAEHLMTGGEALGIAAVANNDGYNSYVIPQRDYLTDMGDGTAYWSDPWDDMSTSYTPQFAMLHGTVAYTVELPAYNDATAQAACYGMLGQSVYIAGEKLGYLEDQVKIYQRGVNNYNSDAFDEVGQWFCDQYDVEGAEMDLFRPEYDGEGQNGNFYPECYIIPLDKANQSNIQAAADMMEWLTRNDVKVGLAEHEVIYDGVTYPEGTMVVPMYQAKRSVANGALYDGTLIQSWTVLYSEGITAFGETRGFDMVTVAEPEAYQKIKMGIDLLDYEAAQAFLADFETPFTGAMGGDVIIHNTSEDAVAAVNELLQKGAKVGMITDDEVWKGDFVCAYEDYLTVADHYLLTVEGVTVEPYTLEQETKTITGFPVVYVTGTPAMTLNGGCIYTAQVGNYTWNYDDKAMKIMGFETTNDLSVANVIIGGSNLSNDALAAVQAGTPYIGFGSGGRSAVSKLFSGAGTGRVRGAMDCLGYVTYPDENMINASYIQQGDDVFYGYGVYWFTGLPEGAEILVQMDGSKEPLEGFIPTYSESLAASYDTFINGSVQGFSYEGADASGSEVDVCLFANTLTNKLHQRDEYAFISNFIFSNLLGEDYSEGTEPVSDLDEAKEAAKAELTAYEEDLESSGNYDAEGKAALAGCLSDGISAIDAAATQEEVAAALAAAKEAMDAVETAGQDLPKLDPAYKVTADNVSDGVKVNWNPVTNAETYQVLYKEAGSAEDYKAAADPTAEDECVLSGDLFDSGMEYQFVVKASAEGYQPSTSEAVSLAYLDQPEITALSNVNAGIKVTWGAVEGAEEYILVMENKSTGQIDPMPEKITSAGYTVPKSMLTAGTEYNLYVMAGKGKYSSAFSEKEDITYLAAPVVATSKNVNAGTQITWNAVDGAESYIVMYKENGGSWKTAVSGVTATTYTVPKSLLKSGTKYYYTVKAVGEDPDDVSGYTSGKAQTYMAAPTVTKTQNVNAGTKVTWSAVDGATKYTLMFKTSGGSWKTLKTGIKTTTYTVPKSELKSGTKYYYTVKAVGAATSGYSSGKAQTYMAAPAISGVSKTSSGVKVTWGKVEGAKTYTVMYKVSGGSWKTAKSGVTGTSYTVPKSLLTSGKTYYFTAKAVGAATSGYSSGKSLAYKA